MSDTTTAPAAQDAPDSLDGVEAPDTPAAEEAPATGELSDDSNDGGDTQAAEDAQAADEGDDDGQDDDADTFPRRVVEKLRKEAASLRDRARTAEERAQAAEAATTALQQRAADEAIKAAGLKPAAVWHDSKLADVLADDGSIDAAKLAAAMKTAERTLDVRPRRPVPRPGAGAALRSGAGVPPSRPPGFEQAFAPRPK